MPRVLCVDYGGARVGLAVSDAMGRTAQPLEVVQRRKGASLVDAVLDVARRVEAEEIVVGLPLRLDGSSGLAADSARSFATALEERWGGPVALWDERLSTAEASKQMRATGVRAREQRESIDMIAAAMILRSFLDARAPERPHPEDAVLPEQMDAPRRRRREGGRAAGRPSLRRRDESDWRDRRDQMDDS